MSMALMAKAMGIKVGNPLRKLVLIKLADNASDTGECWPSYQHIADQCEISRRSVIGHINELIEANLLRKESRTGPNGSRSNVYVLTLGRGESPAPGGESPALGGESPALGGESPALGGGESPAPRTSHSFEPVNEPVKEPKDPLSRNLDDRVVEVIAHLNSVTGSKFKSSSKSHSENINARLGDGYTVDDLKAVIDLKHAEWGGNQQMCQYLRPKTLFQIGKFDGYLAATRCKPAQRKATPTHDVSGITYEDCEL